MITGHLMNQFRFTGPSATVDTACSSSISALEMAVTDLMTGRCQFAMVTGDVIFFYNKHVVLFIKMYNKNKT